MDVEVQLESYAKIRKQMSWMPWISVYDRYRYNDLSLKVRTKEKSWINFI